MRTILALFFFVLASSGVFAQANTDCQVERLKGPVKTLRWEEASFEQGKRLAPYVVQTIVWDKTGYESERVMFAGSPSKREPLIKVVSAFDAKRLVRTERMYDVHKLDPKNNMPGGVPLDAEGKPLKFPPPPPPKPKAPDGATIDEIQYKFDAARNRIEELSYDGYVGKSKLSFRHVYRWDERGRLTEESSYDEAGKLSSKTVYKYDEQGNELERLDFDEKGKNTSRETYSDYQFDAHGNWTQRVKQMDYVAAYNQRIKTAIITYRRITYWE